MKDNIIYRAATLEDIPTLLDFEQELIAYERPFDSNLKDSCTYYDLDYLITSSKAQLIVGSFNKVIITCGYAKIVQAKHYHKNTEYSYMGFMYVNPEFRGQGIIQETIAQLKKWSVSKNILEARLEVYNDNTSALKAYENNGFKKHMIEMKIHLK
ncbi:GNAT family N-acetyltransferase [Lacinutrix sp. Bg11-31]|uniref:GNAT family N-acetyltransferase n=1 Tax=Lacinutrix sp. Bg11-31 TaxID=2057808 RepID=UPI000C313C54|nr:GNAT family N-acetyltransferase [Lacinutrix sp. Bg11-31]AUC80705.1 GNAT family N-acetyltransferase [Lacinutrix sp. Bg11-31]